MLSCVLLATVLGAMSPVAEGQPRQEINLSGQWEYARVTDLSRPPEEGWQPCRVPGLLHGVDYQRAWFRTEFQIPETMRGMRIVVHFGGVKFNSVVRVNGQPVGRHFGGHEPFDVDITQVARPGQANRLELGCHDWTGVFVDNETDFSVLAEGTVQSRSLPRDKILAPIGGLNEEFGPWDDVKLRCHPALSIKDLFIKPSVREKLLRVSYTLENLSARPASVELGATVDDEDGQALALGYKTGTVPAQGSLAVQLEQPWENPHHWSPEHPHLYFLESSLRQGGQTVDTLRTRFGFREFWVDGPRFYLNGVRINLLATSWWPSRTAETPDEIRDRMRRIKEANCVIFRTHTQPWREVWYDIADEMGLMMIPEGAIWNDDEVYRIEDPRFWDNYAAHLKAMVDRDKNKPSVVMYSLENEMYGGRLNDSSPAKKDLARMGELMHQWDPTRPIMYESDGDPLGVADVIGVHYPHEYPTFTKWPNTAYWMDEPLRIGHQFLEDGETWLWDRKKPVYVGEFLWVPSSDPSWHTVFYGDDAYLNYRKYHAMAKGESWRMAIQAYRRYEVGGISPWTMVEGGPLDDGNPMYAAQKYAMQHVAAYVREYDHNFYGTEKVTRTADVYNDVLSPSSLLVSWALMDGDKRLSGGERRLVMEPGERQEIQFELEMPLVTERTSIDLSLKIRRGGELAFEDQRHYSVFPPPALRNPEAAVIGLYDPGETTRPALMRYGLQTRRVSDLGDIEPQVRVLIVGAEALQDTEASEPVIGPTDGPRGGLMEFVRGGGRALVLEHSEYPVGVLPVGLTSHNSTMTFAQMESHPILKAVTADDLKWWRPDNVVTAPEPPRPEYGAYKAIVVSGSSQGLAFAPLLEAPLGKGTLILCQMKVVSGLQVEPTAAVILQNAVEYLAQFEPLIPRTALYCPDPQTKGRLDALRLVATDITDNVMGAPWDTFDLLVACGPLGGLEQAAERMAALVERGGTLLLHRAGPEDWEALNVYLDTDLAMIRRRGPAVRIPGAHALSEYFANEDLYWLGTVKAAHSWATKPLATGMADVVFTKSLAGKNPTEYMHTEMTVAGAHAGHQADSVALPSGGSSATLEIDVPEAGPHIIGIVAGGTQAEGVWPAGAVSVDGEPFGTFACARGEFDTYTVFGDLTAGEHEVQITFTNDAYNPPDQDRNLSVRSVLVARDAHNEDLALLTTPPAAIVVERGPGRVVVDNINWDTTEGNQDKATRYICGLLTGLGAQFEQAGATVLQAETFEHDPNMNWFRTDPGAAYLGDSGYISKRVRCAAAGAYTLRIIAKGTPVKGVYPIIALEVDGEHIEDIELTGAGWRAYPVRVDLAEGGREIKLIFTNDEWDPPEDRNLTVDKIEAYPAP